MANAELPRENFLGLLEKLIAETPHLMNSPPEHVPQESLAARHILAILKPLSEEHGGPLKVREIIYHEGRSNIIVEYPGTTSSCISFVGCHLDVVHANPAVWDRDPFKLQVDGDMMYGRGTTDCLGHCALLTQIFALLATEKPVLKRSVFGVFIADEEVGTDPTIGVTALMNNGEMKNMKDGPLIWLDCADCLPCIGSGGAVTWKLHAQGVPFHSGFPDKAINSIELAHDALRYIQKRFYEEYGTHEREAEYGFPSSSSLKPTQTSCAPGGLNVINPWCDIEGDIRLIPFYRIKDCKASVEKYVQELNRDNFAALKAMNSPTVRGPNSKYCFDAPSAVDPAVSTDAVPTAASQDGLKCDCCVTRSVPGAQSSITWTWGGPGKDGLAADISSPGFQALRDSTIKYMGSCTTIADTGTLPCVAELQASGK